MYALLLENNKTVIRFDNYPTLGEVIIKSLPLTDVLTYSQFVNWDTEEVETLPSAIVEQRILDMVDGKRSTLSSSLIITDPVKQIEYLRKGAEALNDTGPWPWLEELSFQKGTNVEDERLAVLAAMDSSETSLRAISATALTAKAAIRSASTIEEKKAIYDAIIWPNINGE